MNAQALNISLPAGGGARWRRSPGGKDGCLETSTRLANGDNRIVEIHSSTVSVQGQPRLFAILHDITRRKHLERLVLKISDEERRRLGRDLDESLGQKLSGVALASKALSQSLATQAMAECTLAEEIRKCLKEAINETHNIAQEAWPVGLSTAGLTSDLQEFAFKIGEAAGVRCHFHAADGVHLADEFAAAQLFRIAREAVTIAIEYGQARNVTIELTDGVEGLVLEIQNDGQAVKQEVGAAATVLSTMKDRASAIGGRLEFEDDSAGVGIVRCVLPHEMNAPSGPMEQHLVEVQPLG